MLTEQRREALSLALRRAHATTAKIVEVVGLSLALAIPGSYAVRAVFNHYTETEQAAQPAPESAPKSAPGESQLHGLRPETVAGN